MDPAAVPVDPEAAAREAAREAAARALRERQQLERLVKRAGTLANLLRKWLREYSAARQQELDAAKAAAAAKALGKGKRAKKAPVKKGAKEDAGGKKKKVPTAPVALAWASLMMSLDELVLKSKVGSFPTGSRLRSHRRAHMCSWAFFRILRDGCPSAQRVTLEDFYRAMELLPPSELLSLR
jgi:hypothetical protein